MCVDNKPCEVAQRKREHTVLWEIELDADNKKEAAEKALEMITDMQSSAHSFQVYNAQEFKDTDEIYYEDILVQICDEIDLDRHKETAESFKGDKTTRMLDVNDVIRQMENDIDSKATSSLEELIKSIHPSLLRKYLGV